MFAGARLSDRPLRSTRSQWISARIVDVISPSPRSPLQRAARIVLLAGAVSTIGLTLYASRHNRSLPLRLIFLIWELFPFLTALLANRLSTGWARLTRTTLHVSSLVVTLTTLAIYAVVAFGQPNVKMGFVFLVLPPASGLLMAVAVLIASLL
jgi:hypothetical protein